MRATACASRDRQRCHADSSSAARTVVWTIPGRDAKDMRQPVDRHDENVVLDSFDAPCTAAPMVTTPTARTAADHPAALPTTEGRDPSAAAPSSAVLNVRNVRRPATVVGTLPIGEGRYLRPNLRWSSDAFVPVCLAYAGFRGKWDEWTRAQRIRTAASIRVDAVIAEGGELPGLRESATTLTLERRKVLLTDGPFVDSKEFLAGLILVEAENLDGALALAAELKRSTSQRRSRSVRCSSRSSRGCLSRSSAMAV